MFTGFAVYDDEGYMLTALQSFLNQGALYEDVFSQYGPFYYEIWGVLFSVFGIPVSHDGGRSVTLAVWLLSSLMIGLATARMTGSVVLGLGSQMLVFASLGTLTSEPMHPGGLIVLLLALIVLVACCVRTKPSVGPMAVIGGVVAALMLVKINVGVFALAALVLACSVSYSPLANRRWLRMLAEGGFIALPFVLMASTLGESWARDYATHVAVAAVGVVIVLRTRDVPRRASEELWWLGGGFLAVAVLSCLAVVMSGTSPGSLLDGLVGQPLKQSDAFSIPFEPANRIYLLDAAALSGAAAYWYVARGRGRAAGAAWASVVPLVSILVGIQMALSPIGRTLPFDATNLPGYQLSLLAFAWLALVPSPGNGSRAFAFGRLLLPLLAVLQALHAFPVAGSQILWSAFLLVPVGVICVGNGIHGLVSNLGDERERRAFAIFGALGAVLLIGFVANAVLREPLRDARAAYNASIPLDLPGARNVRLGPEEVELYRSISTSINANCETFLALPGMNSFYVWTEREPPTGHNATAWMTLFDDERQRAVIGGANRVAELCLLENEPLAAGWGAIPEGPLVKYMRKEFKPISNIGEYRLLKRVPSKGHQT